jgi:sulfate adenylyltransferase
MSAPIPQDQASSAVLISPFGGSLVDLLVAPEALAEARAYANRLPSLQISDRSACDLELLATGAFSPLSAFMRQADFERVVHEWRLRDGTLFPIPITLSVDPAAAHLDQDVALRNTRNELLAIMTVEELYAWDAAEAAQLVFGTQDLRHPLVAELQRWGRFKAAGALRVLQVPRHYDFQALRLTPAQTRARLAAGGRANAVAFQTRRSLHRAHEEFARRSVDKLDGVLLLQPMVGLTQPGDVDHYTRVRAQRVLAERYFAPDRILLSLLPLAPRLAGPREAVWHALVSRNYGASHLIIGRDHASPGQDSAGRPFYEPFAAQVVLSRYSAECGVQVVPLEELVYLPDEQRYEAASKVPQAVQSAWLSSHTASTEYLNRGQSLPAWFTRPEVAEILEEVYPPRHRQGLCVWLTGLSGAGKSTVAEVLTVLLLEFGRQVTLLDGDVVRTHLSRGLGFGKEDRDINIRRIGYVAAELVRHGGTVICAAVSPYRAARNDVRTLVGAGQFVEVFVDTPLEVCEARDVKGMYAKARRGEIKDFTGIDDPYEPPLAPELRLETVARTPEANARLILDYVIEQGFVRQPRSAADRGTTNAAVVPPIQASVDA